YGSVVTRRLRAMGIRDKPTAPASPWQNGFVDRSGVSVWTTSLSWARCICARFCNRTHAITTTSGRTGHWTKMHQSLVKFSESEASNHMPSLADFTTTMAELKFSVHTAHHPHALCRLLPKGDAVVEEVDLSLR